MTRPYDEFLASKRVVAPEVGFEAHGLNPHLMDWQALIVAWAIRRGRAALWEDCGLGKSIQALAWADQVVRHTNKPVLILCPLAVAAQFRREGEKFGVEVTVCRKGSDVKPGINVTNYQMLRHFDPAAFVGVVCDESDILANYTGKTKQAILEAFRDTPFKLDCSATPAPNDHLELGNHADFLSVMESHDMICRWFINDTMEAGAYRLKRHAESDFWRWVASWATAISRPSDLGYEDGGFALPPLEIVEHVVPVDLTEDRQPGFLIRIPEMSATSMHREMRRTAEVRAAQVAELIEPDRPWIVWCHTDYEAAAVKAVVPDAVEIKGPDRIEKKEELIEAFSVGQARVLLSKPSICGHGLNWQHCRDVVYVGQSYSFKHFYQSIRRCWRFGQTAPVTAHLIMAETEGRVRETIRRKQADHDRMRWAMVDAVSRHGLGATRRVPGGDYNPNVPMALPTWMEVPA